MRFDLVVGPRCILRSTGVLLPELHDKWFDVLFVDERGRHRRPWELKEDQRRRLDFVKPGDVIEHDRAEVLEEGEGREDDPVHEPLFM